MREIVGQSCACGATGDRFVSLFRKYYDALWYRAISQKQPYLSQIVRLHKGRVVRSAVGQGIRQAGQYNTPAVIAGPDFQTHKNRKLIMHARVRQGSPSWVFSGLRLDGSQACLCSVSCQSVCVYIVNTVWRYLLPGSDKQMSAPAPAFSVSGCWGR